MKKKRFTATATARGKGVVVRVPFDPDEIWGTKRKHHITGTVDGMKMRGVLEPGDAGWEFRLGPMWMRDCGVSIGARVRVEVAPEGPQRDGLAPDLAAALAEEHDAGEFFDSLAQFYR